MGKWRLHQNFITIIFGWALLSAVGLFFPAAVLSQIDPLPISTEGFESKNFSGGDGWLAKWIKNGGVRLVKNNPHEGKRYAYITGGRTPGYFERAVNLSNVSSARLKFAGRVKSFENKDKAYVKVSQDGVNYTVVAEFTSMDSDNQWHLYDIDLSAFTMSADFRIVFEGAMGHKTKDKWYIDGIEVVGDNGSGPGAKTFTVTAVKDNLDNQDLHIMADKLSALGYEQHVLDTNVTSAELKSYLRQDTSTLYHTGHGNNGTVATSDGSINAKSTTINVRNTIWATCLTLKNTGWRNAFGPRADTISGYTNFSFDNIDNTVVKTFAKEVGNGKSYPVAWYLANNGISSLSDRWCIYARSNGKIVEYSARTNNPPKDDNAVSVQLDRAGKVRVAKDLLNTHKRYKSSFENMKADPAKVVAQVNPDGFSMLKPTALSESDAIAAVEVYLDGLGEMSSDMILDTVYSIQSRTSDDEPHIAVGWVVRYAQQAPTGLFVRGNSVEPHKTVIITQGGDIMAMSKYWPVMTMTRKTMSHGLMDVGKALQKASEAISRRVKQSIEIEAAEPVYGIGAPNAHSQELIPAYGYSTSDNVVIVVNARTGELLH